MAKTMGQQAHYSTVSARSVALGAALEAVNQQIRSAQFVPHGDVVVRREKLAADLIDLTNNLERAERDGESASV